MAFCTKCGAQIPDGASSCPSCGASVTVNLSKPEAPAQQTPPPGQQTPPPQYAAPPYQQYQYQQQYISPESGDHTAEFDAADISENKVFAMATYLLGVVGIIIALLASRESRFAKFHVRQSLKIQVSYILSAFLLIIPILGWIAAGVCWVILVVVEIISFFNAAAGKAKDAPIVGSLSFLK